MSDFTYLKLFKNWKFINYQLESILIKEYIYVNILRATMKIQRVLNCPVQHKGPAMGFQNISGYVSKDEFSLPVNRNLSRWYLLTVLRAIRRHFKRAIN
jgi:hypothetical protein